MQQSGHCSGLHAALVCSVTRSCSWALGASLQGVSQLVTVTRDTRVTLAANILCWPDNLDTGQCSHAIHNILLGPTIGPCPVHSLANYTQLSSPYIYTEFLVYQIIFEKYCYTIPYKLKILKYYCFSWRWPLCGCRGRGCWSGLTARTRCWWSTTRGTTPTTSPCPTRSPSPPTATSSGTSCPSRATHTRSQGFSLTKYIKLFGIIFLFCSLWSVVWSAMCHNPQHAVHNVSVPTSSLHHVTL